MSHVGGQEGPDGRRPAGEVAPDAGELGAQQTLVGEAPVAAPVVPRPGCQAHEEEAPAHHRHALEPRRPGGSRGRKLPAGPQQELADLDQPVDQVGAFQQAGAGGVGLACVQLAKRAGAKVIATAGDDKKIQRLQQEFGVDHGINYRDKDFVAEARRLTDGKGVDLVIDSVGGSTLEGSIKALAYRGRAISVGNASRGERAVDPGWLSEQNRSLTGVFFGAEVFSHRERVTMMFNEILRDIAKGELKVVIDRTFPLAEAAAAHAYIESRAAFGRVVLVP